MLDGYGGWDSRRPLSERRTVKSPAGTFGYVWEQADFNPIDNQALCHIHFEFKNGKRWKRAFTYDWRLYSPGEVCDALQATGFHNIEVLWDFEEDEKVCDFRPASAGRELSRVVGLHRCGRTTVKQQSAIRPTLLTDTHLDRPTEAEPARDGVAPFGLRSDTHHHLPPRP